MKTKIGSIGLLTLSACMVSILSFTQARKSVFETNDKYIYTPNHRDGDINSGNHRNNWTSLEQGMMQALFKADRINDDNDCLNQGSQLINVWFDLAVKWVKEKLNTTETDEELEDFFYNMEYRDEGISSTQTDIIALSFTVATRCNYVATIEGLIGNKMLVDTVFEAPSWFPFWLKVIIFFMVTIPVNLFTVTDDVITGLILYERFKVHSDFFDVGIVAGKVARIIF